MIDSVNILISYLRMYLAFIIRNLIYIKDNYKIKDYFTSDSVEYFGNFNIIRFDTILNSIIISFFNSEIFIEYSFFHLPFLFQYAPFTM